VDEFHRRVLRTLTVNGVAPAARILEVLEEGLVLQWSFYAAMLFDLDIPLPERLEIKAAWQAIDPSRHRANRQPQSLDPLRGRHGGASSRLGMANGIGVLGGRNTTSGIYRHGERELAISASPTAQALRPMRESELVARNPQEFTELLHTVQQRSGLNAGEIAKKAGIPRSQAYAMIRRGTLPTKVDQVKGFLDACGLPERQARHVLSLWNELHEREHRRDAHTRAAHWTVQGEDPTSLWSPSAPVRPNDLAVKIANEQRDLLADLPDKLRVHALAKLLDVSSRDVMTAMADLGEIARSAQSSLSRDVALKVLLMLTSSALLHGDDDEPYAARRA
jgi:hypothetical protein